MRTILTNEKDNAVATPRRKTSVMSHPVVIAFLILAVVASMSLASEVLKPLALAILLTFALTPIARFLERWKLPRGLAVVLTLLLALGTLGAVGYVVGKQVTSLAVQLPEYKDRIQTKIDRVLNPEQGSALKKVERVMSDVSKTMTSSPMGSEAVTSVRIIQEPTFRERLQSAVGPYLEFLGVASFVFVLVLFMMLSREDLRDRILQLFGHSRVSLTTRTMNEIGQRISRYLTTFTAVNSCYGLVIGLGLWAIGLPMAVLWGSIAALTRFIPYVGPAVAFALPLLFSVARFEGWTQPLEVLLLFAVVETLLNSFLEPVIYGKTTGVSALGLLVAAMFWTWLWGLLGLLLSTPLTVCLAVLGKYVPGLGIFAILLGEEAELDPDVRFYQRLLALDRDSADEVVEAMLKTKPRSEVFDTVLIPALSHAERDAAAGHLEDQDLAFVWGVVEEIVNDLEGVPEISLETVAQSKVAVCETSPLILGVAVNDTGDVLVLKMLAQLLEPRGLSLEILPAAATPMLMAERVAERNPAMVVLSHLPPHGLTSARYQLRRLRARFASLPIVVGRWAGAGSGESAAAEEGLTAAGATFIVHSLAEACDRIVAAVSSPAEAPSAREFLTPASAPAPALEATVSEETSHSHSTAPPTAAAAAT